MEKSEQKNIRKENEVFFENWNKLDKILGGVAILILMLTMIYSALNR